MEQLGATVLGVATATSTNIGTIALADQLNHLRARIPLSESDIARATGTDEATVRTWIDRKAAPMGDQANRLSELIAVVDEMALNVKAESIPGWLASELPALGGTAPADVIAGGSYERVMSLAAGLSAGAFT
jgi:DNA-binding transcriptional regulator YiaG